MKYVSAILQARVRLGQDEAYRAIALQAANAQAETATTLSPVGATLTKIQSRLMMLENSQGSWKLSSYFIFISHASIYEQ